MIKINRPICPYTRALTNKNYKHPRNKEALVKASFGKCMYCESIISHIYTGDIEHIKPKVDFPDLEFNWNNLGFACWKCNNKKSNRYTYINPYNENPNEHLIAVGGFIKHKNGSERGELTILDINLNRHELLEKRMMKMDNIEKTIDSCFRTDDSTLRIRAIEELKKEADKDKEYSLCIKYLLESHGII